MKNSDKMLAGLLVSAILTGGIIIGLKKKSAKKRNIKSKTKDLLLNAEDHLADVKKKAKGKAAESVFNIAVSNRKMIGKLVSFILPYVLKGYIKKKL